MSVWASEKSSFHAFEGRQPMSGIDKPKPFPVFETDEVAETFVDEADLSEFDFSGFRPAHFEFKSKDAQVVDMGPPRPSQTDKPRDA